MKARVFGLAALLLAGAAQGALAQERGGRGGHEGGGHEGGGRGGAQSAGQGDGSAAPGGWQSRYNTGAAREASGGGQAGGQDGGGWRSRYNAGAAAQAAEAQPGAAQAAEDGRRGGPRPDAGRTDPTPPPADRDRGERGRDPRGHGDRDWGQRGDGSRRDGNRAGDRPGERDGGYRDRGSRDDRQDWRRGDSGRDRYGDGRFGDGRGGDRARRWEPHRLPPVYRSPSRYHSRAWRPPAGYYARAWRFGELLPRTWYASPYQLYDWYDFGLLDPPPGYVWVRVGEDALLVDSFDGRIVQVIRDVFW
jgi:Ni/Co efflux regulator RcnB